MDLKGTYNLVKFHLDEVRYLASQTPDDHVILFLVGIFGWSGTPAAFQVVTRAIVHELRHALAGKALMYVDDIFGVSLTGGMIKSDMILASAICEDLLGQGAVEESNTERGRLDVIGYTIDLDEQIVTIADKNVLRALPGFMT